MSTNLTLTLDQELLLEARKLALERGTSVNQLVRSYLASLVAEEGRPSGPRAVEGGLFEGRRQGRLAQVEARGAP